LRSINDFKEKDKSDKPKQKVCKKCGAKVDANIKYCTYCDNEFDK